MSHEVEVKPYGTKNEIETRVYTAPTQRNETDFKPPYGQKNEVLSATTGSIPSERPASSAFSIGGTRADVEVKPYGTTDQLLNKPQQQNVTTRTTISRPANLEQWRNPLMATLLGITLALSLLSLSYLPRAITGAWHWGTSWVPGFRHTEVQPKSYDYYDSTTKSYMKDMAGRDSMYQKGKEMYREGVDQASDMLQRAKGQAADTLNSAEYTGESILQRAKHTGESLYERARDTVLPSTSMTMEARRAACQTAQSAAATACNGVSWTSSGPNVMDRARDTAYDAQNKAAGTFEQAKMRASDILEHAKDTVMYPINAVKETVAGTGDKVQAARDTIVNNGEYVRDSTYNTAQAARNRVGETYQAARDTVNSAENSLLNAKDTALNAGQRAADTVLNAGQAAKDTVLNAGQAAKDTVVGAGQAAANLAGNTIHTVKDTVNRATTPSDHTHTTDVNNGRGPTRVKVEVQEL